MRLIQRALTFDDVLLVPAHSTIMPRDVTLKTRLTRNISLNLPLVSAAMDTVTESRLAIALAQEGGIGIVHKNLSPKAQAAEVAKVKRFESGILKDPITVPPNMSVRDVLALTRLHRISGVPVLDGQLVVGIVTNRDLRFETRLDQPVSNIMTPRDRLVTVHEGATVEEGKALIHKHRLERVLVVNDAFELRGLITVKDIIKTTEHPDASKDAAGRLRVGAAVGVGPGTEERAELLAEAGVDVLVVDTAHGHSQGVLDRVRWIKKNFPAGRSDRRQHRHRRRRAGDACARRRRRQGGHRSGLDLHHAHRRRRRRAANHRHPDGLRCPQGQRRADDRRRRHPLLGRHLEGDCRRW
jgi:IMP dehydrogenase